MMKKKNKKNIVMLFNVFYGMSFLALYLPKFFFPNPFFLRSSLVWQILFTTTAFSFYDNNPIAVIVYGMIFTMVMISYLLMFTKEMRASSRIVVLILYLILNVGINVVLSEG